MQDLRADHPKLMLDLSVFASQAGVNWLLEASESEFQALHIPASLPMLLEQPAEAADAIGRFLSPAMVSIDDWPAVRNRLSQFISYSRPEALSDPGFELMQSALSERLPDPLASLLLEEWMFLQSESWIAARWRATFRIFRQAGAILMEFPREQFDGLAARTLRLPQTLVPPELTGRQRLRAVAKWVAVGGPPVVGLAVAGPLGAVVSSATGFFLLFDP